MSHGPQVGVVACRRRLVGLLGCRGHLHIMCGCGTVFARELRTCEDGVQRRIARSFHQRWHVLPPAVHHSSHQVPAVTSQVDKILSSLRFLTQEQASSGPSLHVPQFILVSGYSSYHMQLAFRQPDGSSSSLRPRLEDASFGGVKVNHAHAQHTGGPKSRQ